MLPFVGFSRLRQWSGLHGLSLHHLLLFRDPGHLATETRCEDDRMAREISAARASDRATRPRSPHWCTYWLSTWNSGILAWRRQNTVGGVRRRISGLRVQWKACAR